MKKHEKIAADSYCSKCEKFMCKNCEFFHTDFFGSEHSSFLIKSNNFSTINYPKDKENNPKIVEENTKYLKDFSNDLNELINKLKRELEIINKKKKIFKLTSEIFLVK